jgi:hypothetical protein
MSRKVSLTYEIYGSASAGEKGHWRWLIISPRSKKTLQVGPSTGRFLRPKDMQKQRSCA